MQVIPSGANWSTDSDDHSQIKASLDRLSEDLGARGLRWADVGLLWLANSRKMSVEPGTVATAQQEFDTLLLDTLTEFCEQQGAWPSLIGSTVKSAFCFSDAVAESDIGDGLMWVAFSHRLLPRFSLGIAVTAKDNSQERRDAGRLALEQAVASFTADLNANLGLNLEPATACSGALGIILTSGSGHIAGPGSDVDFRDCYGVGQGLLQAAERLGLSLTGGCASNRLPEQSQCLYYTVDAPGGGREYRATYDYGAVVGLLPAAQTLVQLDHPYTRSSDQRLTLDFHPHEQYAEGRFFCVRSINGRPPLDFLKEHWTEISPEEFQAMVDERSPIPAKPKAHLFSIASSQDPSPRSLWPNIPIYFERVRGEVLLRLVRAESEDAYFYPIRMTPDELIRNAQELQESFEINGGPGDSLVTFLCESRKYVLEEEGNNGEVETMARARPEAGNVLGVYLNGEYSIGEERSIGYHNYSQIGVMFNEGTVDDLPPGWGFAAR
jgi:hypothetical protein